MTSLPEHIVECTDPRSVATPIRPVVLLDRGNPGGQ